MNRLESASARFAAALDALETGVAERLPPGGKPDPMAAELARLQGERDGLVARIASLEEDSRYLAGLTDEVESRLDGAISEIRDALRKN